MVAKNAGQWLVGLMLAAAVVWAGAAIWADEPAARSTVTGEAAKPAHVKEVAALLGNLKVDAPRTYKNMVVFPIRWGGKQAPGDWTTLDEALASGQLKVLEKESAAVPEVRMENTGDTAVFIMSGELIAGGRQTRVVQKDTVVEARQKVTVPVFCVERRRWSGGGEFKDGKATAPASMRDKMQRGADQKEVWENVRETSESVGARSATESLEEVVKSAPAQERCDEAKKSLGRFSPSDTIGIAVADARTGRVVGVELFGRRDLFERLQEKLIEGYTLDLVPVKSDEGDKPELKKIAEKDVEGFIARAQQGTSKYEDTPGSGRGLDLTSGTLKGKGVAVGESAIHVSIQDVRQPPTPAKPIVEDRPQSER